jgi:hypothetical protein
MGRPQHVETLLAGVRDTSGEPLAAGKVHTYAAGTTTDKDTYTAIDKSTVATNPIILDANGRSLIYADGNYKFVIKTSEGATVYTWDNLCYGLDDGPFMWGGTSTSAGNAYSVSVSPALSDYAAGQIFAFIPNATNTAGSATLNVNSKGAKSIYADGSSTLLAGVVVSGNLVLLQYDGTAFHLINVGQSSAQNYGTWEPTYGAGGSMTYDPVTTTYARYLSIGKLTAIWLNATGTTGGSASHYLTFTLPSSCSATASALGTAYLYDSGVTECLGFCSVAGGSNITVVEKYNIANWGIGSSKWFSATMLYLAA